MDHTGYEFDNSTNNWKPRSENKKKIIYRDMSLEVYYTEKFSVNIANPNTMHHIQPPLHSASCNWCVLYRNLSCEGQVGEAYQTEYKYLKCAHGLHGGCVSDQPRFQILEWVNLSSLYRSNIRHKGRPCSYQVDSTRGHSVQEIQHQ